MQTTFKHFVPLIFCLAFTLVSGCGISNSDGKFRGHKEGVMSAAFSPDGKKIVTTSSTDDIVRIWDVESGMELQTLRGHKKLVVSAVFSPDEKRIVTASADKTAQIWDVESGKVLQTFRGHGDDVNSAAFSPDGKKIITASKDGTARLWDAESGQELHKWEFPPLKGNLKVLHPTNSVKCATFSLDGKKIVTGNVDRIIRIWDVESGKELQTLRGHGGNVNSIVFSPDGKKIVTASSDCTARIWTLK